MRNQIAAALDVAAIFTGLSSGLLWFLSTQNSPIEITNAEHHYAAFLAVLSSIFVAISNLITKKQ